MSAAEIWINIFVRCSQGKLQPVRKWLSWNVIIPIARLEKKACCSPEKPNSVKTGLFCRFALSSKLKGELKVLLYTSSPSTEMKKHLRKLYLGSFEVMKANNLFSADDINSPPDYFFPVYTALDALDTFFSPDFF